jgi:hypothetical protein
MSEDAAQGEKNTNKKLIIWFLIGLLIMTLPWFILAD